MSAPVIAVRNRPTFVAALSHIFWFTLIVLFSILLAVFQPVHADPGCCTVRGNTDCSGDGIVDISDLTALIDHMFISLNPLCCPEAGNTDGSPDGFIDIADLTALIDHMFISLNPMVQCGEMNDVVRMAVIDNTVHLADSLAGDPDFYNKIAAYLNGLPEIDTAQVIYAPSTVWAIFTDSVILMVSNNRLPAPPAINHAPADMKSQTTPEPTEMPIRIAPTEPQYFSPALPTATKSGLPKSLDALFLNTLGNVFQPITSTLSGWLSARGYSSYTGQETVEALRTINGEGVFFFSTHGGAGYFNGAMTDSAYALWTSTITTAANVPTYRADLRAKRLAVQIALLDVLPNGDSVMQAHYGITSRFVTHYWQNLSDNSMVYIDACGSDGPFAQPFKNAVLAKNAGVYFGWTYSVFSDASNLVARFLIDRLLGANEYQSYKESPPQRPFDYVAIYGDLSQRNLHAHPTPDSLVAPGKKTVFKHTAGAGDFGLLAPSIRYMAVVEHFDTLYVTGLFGPDPGEPLRRVLVGGTDMLVYSWSPELITCFIPNTGAGSVGPVTVEIDGTSNLAPLYKRSSNVVNLTTWQGLFTYKVDDYETLERKIVIDARLRADIHAFRDKPHETPHYYSVIFPAMENSFGTATVSGHADYTDTNDPPTTTEWDWHGSHNLKGLWENDPAGFLLSAYVDGDLNRLRLHVVAAEARDLFETITNTPGGIDTYDLSVASPLEIYDTPPGYFYIQMNTVWDILGDSRSINMCCSRDPLNDVGLEDVVHTFSWPTITASWAPDTSAAQ